MQQLLQIFLGASALFLLFKFSLVPRSKRRTESATSLGKRPGAIALHAALGTFANLVFWFAVSAGATLGGLALLDRITPLNLSEAEQALSQVRDWSGWLNAVTGSLGLFGAGAAALGLLWYSHRRTRRIVEEEIARDMSAAIAELETLATNGELPEASPTETMLLIEAEFDKVQAELEKTQKDGAPDTRIAEIAKEAQNLADLYTQVDILSRAEKKVQEKIAERADGMPQRRGVGTFFVSNGFHDTLSGVGKVLAALCVLAIIPASLVLTGPLALDSLDTKRIALEEDARDFEFVVAREEINQAWASAVAPQDDTAEDTEPTEEDLQISAELAQVFEANSVPSSVIRITGRTVPRTAVRVFQREQARQAILLRAAARSPLVSTALGGSAPTNPLAQNTDELLGRLSRPDLGPQTSIGRQVQADALELARRNPGQWTEIRRRFSAYRASFGVAAPPQRLQAIVVNQAIGNIAGNVGTSGGFWSEQARSFGANVSAEAAEAYTQAASRAFLTDFARTGELPGSAVRAASSAVSALPSSDVAALRRVAELPPSADDLTRRLTANRPTLTAQSLNISDEMAVRAVNRASASVGRGMDAAGSLVEFADLFPGHEGQEMETKRARAARKVGLDGAPPSRVRATSAQLRESRVASRRAASFVRLRGFSRIGGVLIGREAEEGPPLRVDHFDWTVEGRTFNYELAVEGGPIQKFGPYDAAIAHLALAYAADGRPTTVTMVTAPPVPELRILIHPALVDTGLGCRARRLDQFADEAAARVEVLSRVRAIETLSAEGEVALYNLTQDLQLLAIGSSPVGQQALESYGISEFVDHARQRLGSFRQGDAAQFRLSDKATPLVIADKPAFFHSGTVELMEQCTDADKLDAYSACIQERATAKAGEIVRSGAHWFAPPVEYQIWSGVREREFQADAGLDFLSGRSESALGPLRFMVQLAISSPAHYADMSREWYEEDNEARDSFTDPDPWEFPETGVITGHEIIGILDNSEEHADIYGDMVSFTRLQRMFRMALDGAMSESFPVDELPAIADATFSAVNSEAPTKRWNTFGGGHIEASLRDLLSGVPKTPAVQACLSLAQRDDAAEIPDDEWNAICAPSALNASLTPDDAKRSNYIADLRALRRELDLQRDDRLEKVYSASGCPKP